MNCLLCNNKLTTNINAYDAFICECNNTCISVESHYINIHTHINNNFGIKFVFSIYDDFIPTASIYNRLDGKQIGTVFKCDYNEMTLKQINEIIQLKTRFLIIQ